MSHYLEHAHIERYGALSDCDVGPFSPGLNVVYGENEAGKSTIASFIGGVLFGWEEAHGVRNTYKPEGGGRAGSLYFSPHEGATGEAELRAGVLHRAHNADGLQGDLELVSDIDSSTYHTMFSLSSDELRSLKNSSSVTARLLTAGSGTGSSPAAAYVEIEQQIAAHMAPQDESGQSIVVLGNELEAKRDELRDAVGQMQLRRQEDRERLVLLENKRDAQNHLAELNAEVDRIQTAKSKLEVLANRIEEKQSELEALKDERIEYELARREPGAFSPQLLELDSSSERAVRDKLDELAEEHAKAVRGVDIAKENSAASSAAYEALLELDEGDDSKAEAIRNRTIQAVVSIALPVAFMVAGVPVVIHGRSINSLSITAMGIGLVVVAFFLAAAAIAMLFRPNRQVDGVESKRKDAQWVMLQDKKKLDSSLDAKVRVEEQIETFLSESGLADANGSLRQARSLLDDAREERTRNEAQRQRLQAVDVRRSATLESLQALEAERRSVEASAGMEEGASLHRADQLLADAVERRDALSAALEKMNIRLGELEERLEQARNDRTFDQLKFEYYELQCRLRERKDELVSLLLAKRVLEKSIAAWESRNQPEVYREAGRLFSMMTDGAWVRISMTADGRMTAVAANGQVREVRHLSLGTCQQLYLSLRIAMLLHAERVGASIPVLADDILVHFDANRRSLAARALAELAEKRQVIVFTCHRETVDALREASSELTFLNL